MCYMHYKMDCCLCPVASKSTTAISTSLENLLFPKKKKRKDRKCLQRPDWQRGVCSWASKHLFVVFLCGHLHDDLPILGIMLPNSEGPRTSYRKRFRGQGVMCSFHQTHFPWKYSDPSRRWKIIWDERSRLSFLCTFWNPHNINVLMPQARFEICQFLFFKYIYIFKNYLVTDL